MSVFLLLLSISGAQASGLQMYERAVGLIEDRYLRLDEFDPEGAFGLAGEQAEGTIPWLIVEADAGAVTITDAAHGDVRTINLTPPDTEPTIAALPDALERLENAILTMESKVDPDVDVAVTLLKEIAHGLDRHSVVMAKGRLERFDTRIKGKLTGIGAKLGTGNGSLQVEEVFDGTPAMRGGLMVDDIIDRVDCVSTRGMSISQSVERIRGPKGSEVILSIIRRVESGTDENLSLVFVRDEVNIPNVSWKMGDDGVGIIEIDHFSEHTARLTRKALESFRKGTPAGVPLQGIVLDLRNNTGGSMIQSAETADMFLSGGVIVETAGRDGKPVPNLLQTLSAHPKVGTVEEPQVPMVVVQNQRSASASEIVAGALVSLNRATIIGRTSYGKGTVQKLYTLRGGRDRVRMKLTVAEYQLAGGVPVHGEGITPDLKMRHTVFNRSGAWVPPTEEEGIPVVIGADERSGWRTEGTPDLEADPLMDIARTLVLGSDGLTRMDGLDAIARLGPKFQAESAEALSRTFGYREIDWRASEDGPGILDVKATIEVMDVARSGQDVQVRAEVTNSGPAPLYRVRVRLLSEGSHVPWHNSTIPIGFIPPGESAIGDVQVAIPVSSQSRQDLIQVRLEADGLDPVDLDPVVLSIESIPAPAVAATATLVPHGDHHRVEVELVNLGESNLTGVRTRFGWRDDSGIELIDQEALLPVLPAGDKARVDLELRVLESADPNEIPVELRVDAERFQSVLRAPVDVLRSGEPVFIQKPLVEVDAPISAKDSSEVEVSVRASDDTLVSSVALWWHGQKREWIPGDGTTLERSFTLPVQAGSNRLTVVVRDGDGHEVRVRRYVWSDLPPIIADEQSEQ